MGSGASRSLRYTVSVSSLHGPQDCKDEGKAGVSTPHGEPLFAGSSPSAASTAAAPTLISRATSVETSTGTFSSVAGFPPSPTESMASVSELKARLQKLGKQVPADIREKSELLEYVREAEIAGGRSCSMPFLCPPERTCSTDFMRLSPRLSVTSLKQRLRELGFDVPSTILEKHELVQLVHEAERMADQVCCANVSTNPSQLKARLRELRVQVPDGVLEKRELLDLIQEAEGSRRQACGVSVECLPGSATPSPRPPESERSDSVLSPQVYARSTYRDGPLSPGSDKELALRRVPFTCVRSALDGRVARFEPDEKPSSFAEEADSTITTATSVDALEGSVVQAHAPNCIQGQRFCWVSGEVLGRGSLGIVFKALDQNTGEVFAVKEVVIVPGSASDAQFREALEQEIAILQELDHPHIVRYLGHDYIQDRLYMYMEHMAGGSISQILQEFGPFEEALMLEYTQQLLTGLHYLHTRKPAVVHRDIKGGNVLVDLGCRAKLADFGCSKRAQQTIVDTAMRGSIPWMAPEVVAHSRYGRSSDMWSFGCLMIEMATARSPWGSFDNQMAALIKIGMSKERPPIPERLSECCQDLISQCVQRDSRLRPSAAELLDHECVRDFSARGWFHADYAGR